MKTLFNVLNILIILIVVFVFAAGVFVTGLGIYDFTHAFHFFDRSGEHGSVQYATLSLLKAVDLFLLAIVLFVFSLGLMVLFNNKTEQALPPNLPSWLKVKNFIELKVILWEAVLTTLVISYLAYLAELRIEGRPITFQDLTVPGAILLIAGSLFLLKKGEH
ncbi:MAG: YqhA family protein [Chryseolinea sp.]